MTVGGEDQPFSASMIVAATESRKDRRCRHWDEAQWLSAGAPLHLDSIGQFGGKGAPPGYRGQPLITAIRSNGCATFAC